MESYENPGTQTPTADGDLHQDPVGEHGELGELQQISHEIAAVVKQTWGRGPMSISSHWAGSDMIVVVMANGHTEHEKALRVAGHIQELFNGRRLLGDMLERRLIEIVQTVTGRTVETVLSATRLDPDMSSETFLLKPRAEAEQTGQNGSTDMRAQSQALRAEARQARRRRRQISDPGSRSSAD